MSHAPQFVRRIKSVPGLDRHASVAAVVPHYRCEAWLGQCLDSLLSQTRPLQRIIVVDDHSEEPPLDIVRRFPGVTLLTASENVGPYRLIQTVIEQTKFDAYLFNNADDWSARDRLEVLLAEGERTGAELIGSQELRILRDTVQAIPVHYPPDVNAALESQPSSYPLLHPASLVARTLVERLGGFATGMRTNADLEFLQRAVYVASIVNVPEFLYFRRKREPLPASPVIGLEAPAGEEIHRLLWERTRANAARVAAGSEPDLAPLILAGPVHLTHLCGPPLNAVATRPSLKVAARVAASVAHRSELRGAPGVAPADPPAPIFVIGAPRTTVKLLMWSLSQHPNIAASLDSDWVGRLSLSLQTTVAPLLPDVDGVDPGSLPARGPRARSVADVWDEFGKTVHRLVAPVQDKRWVDGSPDTVFHVYGLRRLFPNARFIHVVREAAPSVESLVNGEVSDEAYHTEASALEFWLRASRAGLDAERALGSETVMRLRHEDIVRSPDRAIRRCLEHVGETYFEGCTWPLTSLAEGLGETAGEFTHSIALADDVIRAFEREILTDAEPELSGHPHDLAKLARDFTRRGRSEPAPQESSPVRRLKEAIMAAVPRGGVVLVVSRGDDELLELGDRVAWHFPRAESGDYAGYHPANSGEAIEQLERQRELGAEYLVFPSSAFWWLDFYPEFRQHVERNCRASIHQQDSCRIYTLQPLGENDTPRLQSSEDRIRALSAVPAG